MNCTKIGLPGKSILGDYFQESMTFSLTENQFSRKTYFCTIAYRNAVVKSLHTGAAFPAEVPIFMVGGQANYGSPQVRFRLQLAQLESDFFSWVIKMFGLTKIFFVKSRARASLVDSVTWVTFSDSYGNKWVWKSDSWPVLIGSLKLRNVWVFVQLIHRPTRTKNQLYKNPNID